MERAFLENLKVGDTPLGKELIDTILAEHERGVTAAKEPFADYETIKSQLSNAQKTIKGFESQDIDDIRQSAKDWEDKYNKAIRDHKEQMDNLTFQNALDKAITGAKGRNAKAITAMLDVDSLKASKNQAADIEAALKTMQEEHGYLFNSETPPPYSGGAGTGGSMNQSQLDAFRAAAGLSK